jgi:hypothetical protein
MNLPIVKQDNQMASYLSQELAEEHFHCFTMDIVLIEMTVEGTMATFWANGDPRDG